MHSNTFIAFIWDCICAICVNVNRIENKSRKRKLRPAECVSMLCLEQSLTVLSRSFVQLFLLSLSCSRARAPIELTFLEFRCFGCMHNTCKLLSRSQIHKQ